MKKLTNTVPILSGNWSMSIVQEAVQNAAAPNASNDLTTKQSTANSVSPFTLSNKLKEKFNINKHINK